MTRRRVVITGIGVISACGEGAAPLWEAVKYGKTAIAPVQSFEHPFLFAGECRAYDPKPHIKKRKSLKIMSRDIQLAMGAAHLALEDSGLDPEGLEAERFGVSFGTGVINYELEETGRGILQGVDSHGNFSMPLFGQEGIRSLFPLWSLKYVPNMPACHVSIEYGLKGPSNTVTTSGAAALQAIGEAGHIIERGDADLMMAGGTDSQTNPIGFARMQSLGLLASSEQSQKTYCPFNEGQDGFVLGEGSGMVILEEYEHARRRGARIYGEIKGFGSSIDDGMRMDQTLNSRAKSKSMERALKDAGLTAGEIDFLIASGSGLAHQDEQECEAVRTLFGTGGNLRVTGLKPITGHTHHAAGGIEICGGLLALENQTIPPLASFRHAAENNRLPFAAGEFLNRASRNFMINSFGLFGHNASMVVGRVEAGAR